MHHRLSIELELGLEGIRKQNRTRDWKWNDSSHNTVMLRHGRCCLIHLSTCWSEEADRYLVVWWDDTCLYATCYAVRTPWSLGTQMLRVERFRKHHPSSCMRNANNETHCGQTHDWESKHCDCESLGIRRIIVCLS